MNKTMLTTAIVSAMLLNSTSLLAENESEKSGKNEIKVEEKNKKSDWDFSGQAAIYYQTVDGQGNGSLFDQGPRTPTSGWAKATGGLQLRAVNKDFGNGIGAGFELSGLSSLGLHNDIVSGLVQNAGGTSDGLTSASVSQAYLTYNAGNTSFKVGRQELPKGLAPFSFSEGWNVFKNTFDAALVVNTDIENTTLVYAYVTRANNSLGNLNNFKKLHDTDGTHMITAKNTSIDGVTLTGSYYSLPDATLAGGADAFWLDAKVKISKAKLEIQAGTIGGSGLEDTTGYGVKLSGKLGSFNTSFAYSSADDGSLNIANLAGSGVKSPFYTQGVLNQNAIKRDSDSFKFTASTKAIGGTVVFAYMSSDMGATALSSVFGTGVDGEGTYRELELIYKRSLTENTKLFTALINQNDDRQADKGQNFFRVWVRYTL
ncbi:MAG: hypothetical protein COA86_16015 [Kangiella sp.]|nr:MAG: hypothetical protein COA86_16015 [Kangiella sp.]